jgi:hypothetical protein
MKFPIIIFHLFIPHPGRLFLYLNALTDWVHSLVPDVRCAMKASRHSDLHAAAPKPGIEPRSQTILINGSARGSPQQLQRQEALSALVTARPPLPSLPPTGPTVSTPPPRAKAAVVCVRATDVQ